MSDDYSEPTLEQRSLIGKMMRFCLTNKLIVALLVIFIVGWGLRVAPFDWDLGSFPRTPVPTDAIPDIGENQQIVFTRWMGRSPQDVDDQISYPLTNALLGVRGVKSIRSSSMFGFSSIYVIFKEDVNFDESRWSIIEKLGSLSGDTLPQGVQPALGPDATALGQIYWYTLEGRDPDGRPAGGWDLEELRTVQDWTVRHALLAADGVSEVASVGGFTREYQIDVDPDAMRAYHVTLPQVYAAVRASNIDVGAKTLEVNRVEYFIRGIGFIRKIEDIEDSVIKVNDNVPISVKHIATVTLGPGLRRGALDKDGAEAVGGVVVARYGDNPLAVINNLKTKIAELAPGLPAKVLIDDSMVSPDDLSGFAATHGFKPRDGDKLNHKAWVATLRGLPQDERPGWAQISQVTIIPFYDRTGLIYETLGTLNDALAQEILITIIVVILMVMHLRSSALIGSMLPLAVLLCFIAMKTFGVDANIVALSGIAIAIGTIVDMGVVVCENVLRHLDEAPPEAPRLEVIHRAASEVGGAVLTAVATTVVSFLPVFTMAAAEGKLFKPLAFTKTFALLASVVIALTVLPPAAHILFCGRVSGRKLRVMLYGALAAAGVLLAGYGELFLGSFSVFAAGIAVVLLALHSIFQDRIPALVRKCIPWVVNTLVVLFVGIVLSRYWEPLGPDRGALRNFVFVGGLVALLLGFFGLFRWAYPSILRFCLAYKLPFLLLPVLLVILGVVGVWLSPAWLFGPLERASLRAFKSPDDVARLVADGLLEERAQDLVWTNTALTMSSRKFKKSLGEAQIKNTDQLFKEWSRRKDLASLRKMPWGNPDDADPNLIRNRPLAVKVRWSIARSWGGLGKEFRPRLDEGSFLYMPSTMPHASIGESLDVLAKQDMAIRAIPEIESVVGKIGRAETPLDPAPVSMVETVVNYKTEYRTDKDGRRIRFRYDKATDRFTRDKNGDLIPDRKGRPYRQWRQHIKTADDIWEEIVNAAQIPGSTSAPKLQPIETRLVMLQSGMRAPMGIKIKGPTLEDIEKVGIRIEHFLKQVPSVEPSVVTADRIVDKPYLEIVPDRKAMDRYGVMMRQFQDIVEIAIGGRKVTTTVEGRERFPVRVRYQRELRDRQEAIERILVPGKGGAQIPLEEIAEIRFVRGPQVIKSEDTFLIGHVLFDMKPGNAEVTVVKECERFLAAKVRNGELVLPAGVSYTFAGNYENQIRSERRLAVVLPLALLVIFVILYLQFRSVSTTALVFSGIIVAWAGGFILIWLYNQPWFMDFSVFDVNMRQLFQMPALDPETGDLVGQINLSVAVWVGFLALFGIASDDGVIQSTYLNQVFRERKPQTVQDIREATVAAAQRRIRPCLTTSATTILALIPVLTSIGRGSDVMVPMAIPSFGGMLVVLISVLVVPVLYCAVKECQLWLQLDRQEET